MLRRFEEGSSSKRRFPIVGGTPGKTMTLVKSALTSGHWPMFDSDVAAIWMTSGYRDRARGRHVTGK